MEDVPVLDLASDRSAAIQTMDAALREYGFFYVKSHGVDAALVQGQFDMAAQFFALPAATKNSMPFDPQLDIGYVGQGVQSLNPDGTVQHSGDTKEQIMFTNNKLITAALKGNDDSSPLNSGDHATTKTDPCRIFEGSQNYAPSVAGYNETTQEYASALYQLNQQLNDLLFDALKLDEDTRTMLGTEPFVVLKQMRYAGDPSDPKKGKFGAGAHCDWGSFTILATDQTPGLEIEMHNHDTKTTRWLPVPPRPGCFIINSGDQIAQLTNQHYRSAKHRVVTQSTRPRFSTAFFAYFGIQAPVGPLPRFVSPETPALYESKRTLEYFHYKLHESMGAVAAKSAGATAVSLKQ